MPTYEYECTRCGHIFEEIRSIQDPPRKRCPECRGKVERLISGGAGILFRGSGFYVTDSRRSTGGDGNDSARNPSPKTADTKGGTDAKPAPGGAGKTGGET
ncbi:MAG: FmdB family zinc ribbon protein [Candidatus Krumholzibacteriia bacterium]